MRSHLLLLLSATLLATAYAIGSDNYAAAMCSGRGPSCSPSLARGSGLCLPKVWMTSQPTNCQIAACKFCRKGNRRTTSPACKWEAISKNCFGGRSPAPGNSVPRPPRQPVKPPTVAAQAPRQVPKGCVYSTTGNKLVISATGLKIGSQWTRVGNAIVWKKQGGRGIDAKGSGAVCANVRFGKPGIYYFTGISSAPHPTEHNDAWFKFSGGFDLYRPQARSFRSGNNDWYKGYQNNGGNNPANYIVTIDHNGHQMLTKPVVAGRVYKICVAGRSSKYSLFKLAFIKCEGGAACSRFNGSIKQQMQSLPASQCK